MAISVLLVEDDFDLAATVVQYLELEGMVCDYAMNGEEGFNLIKKNSYDVVLLDVMLPRMDGLAVCTRMRREGHDLPVLMLTARDTLDDKLAGFRAGTDDYLVKPFELAEVVARIQVLAQRKSGQMRRLEVGELRMELDRRQVCRAGEPLQLTPTCWKLLTVLMRNSPGAVSKSKLAEAVWGEDPPESNSLKVHMHKLRQQVDGKERDPMIQTVPGYGFALRNHDDA